MWLLCCKWPAVRSHNAGAALSCVHGCCPVAACVLSEAALLPRQVPEREWEARGFDEDVLVCGLQKGQVVHSVWHSHEAFRACRLHEYTILYCAHVLRISFSCLRSAADLSNVRTLAYECNHGPSPKPLYFRDDWELSESQWSPRHPSLLIRKARIPSVSCSC